jgi:hypothetical protein
MSTSGNEKTTSYLTETILSIHNEVQSALDYISTKATEEGTEFGKSSALLSIQNLRIKVPLKVSLETNQNYPELDKNSDQVLPTLSKASLLQRQGFIVQQSALQTPALSTKIKVNLEPAIQTISQSGTPVTDAQEAPKEVWGEIEITFSPIKRQ